MENRQQGRFAGAVGPDQPDPLAFRHCEGNVGKERLASISFTKPLRADDRRRNVGSSPGLGALERCSYFSQYSAAVYRAVGNEAASRQ